MAWRKENIYRKLKEPYGFGWILLIYFAWYAISEIVLTLLPGEWPAIIWIPLHFIVNPLLGVVLSVTIILTTIFDRKLLPALIALAAGGVMTTLSVIGFSGETWLVEFLGISFRG